MAKFWSIVEIIVILALCFFAIPIRIHRPAEDDVHIFQQFVQKYNRSYKDNATEYTARLEIFKESLRKIGQMNAKRIHDNSAIYGVTEYSDLTRDEYLNILLQRNNQLRLQSTLLFGGIRRKKKLQRQPHLYALPQRVDWRTKGVVSKVRDQGSCGACWAHSTVATIESMLAIKTGRLKELSVQQMVDCSLQNMGCRGGDTCLLLSWLVGDYIAVLSKEDYLASKECTGKGAHVTQYSCDDMTSNEDDMLVALALHGPLAVGINAISWQYYLGGVIKFHCDGGPLMLNHAVQVVGYDLSGPTPHYILRNSWGLRFGNDGYAYVAIGDNVCGIAEEVSSVQVKDT